jgi:cytochrome c peroxidase
MISPKFKYAAGAAAILFCALVLTSAPGTRAQEPEGNYGVGIPEVFLRKYLAYRTEQLASGSPDVLRIKIGHVKGLSKSFINMVGEVAVNLDSGAFDISLDGLTPLVTYTVWLVDRPESELPLPDTVFGLVTFLATGPSALLTHLLSVSLLPPGFKVDRIYVAEGMVWGAEPLGAGTVNVFQKIFFRRLSLLHDSSGELLFDEVTSPPALFELVPDLATETDALSWMGPKASPPSLRFATFSLDSMHPVRPVRVAARRSGRSVKLDKLISQGADLFFNNTFGGNGRTCGTCHPVSNNLTIDKPFIATLPANDPLFVAEFNPALAQLERPALMREFGLILENLDGFTPSSRFVMRGVPHTLGLQVSLEQDTALPKPRPAEMTGWSGDGAPGTGSLREFAIGAVTQHFPKRLNRVKGTDFVEPTEHQLDAMETFQLSTGRATDISLADTTFTDATVNTGKGLFINGGGNPAFGGTCAFCHTNAGALSAGLGNQNVNFNTNIEDVPHPARMNVQPFPKDGGFGRNNNGDGTFGNRTFNTPPLVEAADTPPFFHNNLVSTIEAAIDFYSSAQFNNPRAAAAKFNFTTAQRDKIADFLRGVNTLQNIDVGRRELQEILANRSDPRREQDTRLQTAFDETQDAIDVLIQGAIFPSARARLLEARNLIAQAQHSGDSGERRSLIQQAITKLGQARSAVATGPLFT